MIGFVTRTPPGGRAGFFGPFRQPGQDCQEFRVRAGMMGKGKEPRHAKTQRAPDS